jgi:hypothetical protein
MNSITMINRLPPPSDGRPRSATLSPRVPDFARPNLRERVDEILPLLDVVPEAGPPVLFVLGPWLFVVLMLIGPFVLLVTVMLATVLFIATVAALLVLPYLLVHQLRKAWSRRPAPQMFVRPLPAHVRPAASHLRQHSPTDVTSNGM